MSSIASELLEAVGPEIAAKVTSDRELKEVSIHMQVQFGRDVEEMTSRAALRLCAYCNDYEIARVAAIGMIYGGLCERMEVFCLRLDKQGNKTLADEVRSIFGIERDAEEPISDLGYRA